jgi:hypothetical protein
MCVTLAAKESCCPFVCGLWNKENFKHESCISPVTMPPRANNGKGAHHLRGFHDIYVSKSLEGHRMARYVYVPRPGVVAQYVLQSCHISASRISLEAEGLQL